METTWISTENELPPEGQAVLIFDGGINIGQLERGISKVEREKMRRGELNDPTEVSYAFVDGTDREYKHRRSEMHRLADEWGNNEKAYCWWASGRGYQCGQDVRWWMPLPPPPSKEEADMIAAKMEAALKESKVKINGDAGAKRALAIMMAAFAGNQTKKEQERDSE